MSLSSYLPSPSSVIKVLGGIVGASAATAGSALYLFQNRLIYPANLPEGSRTNVPRPEQPYEEITLTTPDGVRLKAFLIMYERDGVEAKDRPTVLLLHANAGNVVRFFLLPSFSSPPQSLALLLPHTLFSALGYVADLPCAGPPTSDCVCFC